MSFERWLIEAKRPVWVWLETVLLTLVAFALAWLAEPSNPSGANRSPTSPCAWRNCRRAAGWGRNPPIS